MNSAERRAALLAALEKRILVLDGAMGTMLQRESLTAADFGGEALEGCNEHLVLSRPDVIAKIHRQYLEAGADIIETNSFGSTSIVLAEYGLADQAREISRAAARLARQAADAASTPEQPRFVAGSMGPTTRAISVTGGVSFAELRQTFYEQARALMEGGADLLLIETCQDTRNIKAAALAILQLRAERGEDIPIIVSGTIEPMGAMLAGQNAEALWVSLAHLPLLAIGLNCATGPEFMTDHIRTLAGMADCYLSCYPNAGLPNEEGKYLETPASLAGQLERFAAQGWLNLVGGCCGTTPEHIQWIRNYVRSTAPGQKRRAVAAAPAEAAQALAPPPLRERSRLARSLSDGEFVTLIEILPPRGSAAGKEIESARLFHQHQVSAINIPDGPRASARMSNQALALMLQQQVGVEAVLHYCCRDRNVISMQSDLLGAYALGVRNLILITGDPPKLGNYPDATAVFDVDAIGLTQLVSNLNRGLDLGGNAIGGQTGFLIGVGANPGNPNFEEELRRFRLKVEAGAEYAVTQPVFETAVLERFLDAIADLRVPVIAGIWPLASARQAEFMSQELHVAVPETVQERLRAAASVEEARQIGLEEAQAMIRALRPRIQGVQISVLGRNQAGLELLHTAQAAAQPAAAR